MARRRNRRRPSATPHRCRCLHAGCSVPWPIMPPKTCQSKPGAGAVSKREKHLRYLACSISLRAVKCGVVSHLGQLRLLVNEHVKPSVKSCTWSHRRLWTGWRAPTAGWRPGVRPQRPPGRSAKLLTLESDEERPSVLSTWPGDLAATLVLQQPGPGLPRVSSAYLPAASVPQAPPG